MTNPLADQITVVTCTLGDSASHLSRCLTELRQFTKIPFRQIVSDDGTADRSVCDRQRAVCEAHGAEWVENPGPTFGISYNLNSVFGRVTTPWAFLVEDGLRPSLGWLETALDALGQVGLEEWNGRKVGALGMATSYENWHLAHPAVLPEGPGLGGTFDQMNQSIYEAFWGSSRHPHWNDGLWCWARMEPRVYAACRSQEADSWPEVIQRTWRQPVLRREMGGHPKWPGHPEHGWQHTSGWPRTRSCCWVMGPSAWGLYNIEAWRKAGKFRDGCTFYEGHLGVRLAREGYLSVNCECPPWFHMSGLAFRCKDRQRTPRHHEPPDGPDGILQRDFGCNGVDHVDMASLARSYFKDGELDAINKELGKVTLHAEEGWAPWM